MCPTNVSACVLRRSNSCLSRSLRDPRPTRGRVSCSPRAPNPTGSSCGGDVWPATLKRAIVSNRSALTSSTFTFASALSFAHRPLEPSMFNFQVIMVNDYLASAAAFSFSLCPPMALRRCGRAAPQRSSCRSLSQLGADTRCEGVPRHRRGPGPCRRRRPHGCLATEWSPKWGSKRVSRRSALNEDPLVGNRSKMLSARTKTSSLGLPSARRTDMNLAQAHSHRVPRDKHLEANLAQRVWNAPQPLLMCRPCSSEPPVTTPRPGAIKSPATLILAWRWVLQEASCEQTC